MAPASADPSVAAQEPIDQVLLERLTLYARRRVSRVTGSKIEQASDYVARAVLETLSGRRTRPVDVSMFAHLAGVVSSLVSHDAEAAENRVTRAWPERATEDGGTAILDMPDDRPTPEQSLIAVEDEAYQSRLTLRVLNALADAPELRRMARLIMVAPGTLPPRRLAEELGCSASEVYNMRKQLQRRLAFLTNQSAESPE